MVRTLFAAALLLASLVAAPAPGEPVALSARLDSDALAVGDETTLRIQLPESVSAESVGVAPSAEQNRVVMVGEIEYDPATNIVSVPVRALSSAIDAFRPFEVTVGLPGDETRTFETEVLECTVSAPVAEEAEAMDYTPYMAAPFSWTKAAGVGAVSAVALAALAFAIVLIVRRLRPEGTAIESGIAPVDPLVELETGLGELGTLARYRSQGTEAHCTALSFLLRRYLERTGQMPAVEMSDDEIIERIDVAGPENPALISLVGVFRDMSLAKFARANLTEERVLRQAERAMAFARAERERHAAPRPARKAA